MRVQVRHTLALQPEISSALRPFRHLIKAGPSNVWISNSVPSAACGNEIGITQCKSSPSRLQRTVRLHIPEQRKIASRPVNFRTLLAHTRSAYPAPRPPAPSSEWCGSGIHRGPAFAGRARSTIRVPCPPATNWIHVPRHGKEPPRNAVARVRRTAHKSPPSWPSPRSNLAIAARLHALNRDLSLYRRQPLRTPASGHTAGRAARCRTRDALRIGAAHIEHLAEQDREDILEVLCISTEAAIERIAAAVERAAVPIGVEARFSGLLKTE